MDFIVLLRIAVGAISLCSSIRVIHFAHHMLISHLQCNQKGAQYGGLCMNLKRTLFSLLVLTLKAVKCWMRWWFNGCSLRVFCFLLPALKDKILMLLFHGVLCFSWWCHLMAAQDVLHIVLWETPWALNLLTWIVLLFPLSTSPSLLSDKSSSRILTDCVCLNYFKLLERETTACLNIELLLPVHRSEKQNLDWKHENVCLC